VNILPLKGGYVIVPEPRYDEVVEQFVASGQTQEWVTDHILKIPFIMGYESTPNGRFPNMNDSMLSAKGEVSEWLQQKHLSEPKEIKVGIRQSLPEVYYASNYQIVDIDYS